MVSLQLSSCCSSASNGSSFFLYNISRNSSIVNGFSPNLKKSKLGFDGAEKKLCFISKKNKTSVFAMASNVPSPSKMNLNEYMVILDKPLGIRFAISVDGKIFVHALKKGGNAEKTRIVLVGDTLKKASNGSADGFVEIKNYSDIQKFLKEEKGSCSLVLERPFAPFPVQQLLNASVDDMSFNKGRVSLVSWNQTVLASYLEPSSGSKGNSGFAVFSPKLLAAPGWKYLNNQDAQVSSRRQSNFFAPPISQLVCVVSEEELEEAEWAHGSFPLEEYIKALDRSKGELYYNHSLGMRYSKITEQLYVGSCIQTEAGVETLANDLGVTAVLNFQSPNECANWGINSESINDACRRSNILMINYPVRDVDSFDLRKKLPFCAGLLLRLLKKNLRVFVTCTTGFDRSPACIVAYLHWMQDTALQDAYNFVAGLHPCRPNRPAIVWATWDLIAMVEKDRHDGPPTHAVTFVWSGREGEDVSLVGDFTGNWKEPVKAVHMGGPKYEAEIKLNQGKYCYKFIVNGNWRHSTGSPTVCDEHGNLNNVIVVGDTASIRPATVQQQTKDSSVVKVIERPLTEYERVMLAKAARCLAFSICPIRLAPK